jgi:hypothetical protein
VLHALGVFGILDAAGTSESGVTIDQGWPTAIIGLGLVMLLAQQRYRLARR